MQVQVKPFADAILTKLDSISQQVIREMAKQDKFTQQIYDSYLQFRKTVVDYHNINERHYMNHRHG